MPTKQNVPVNEYGMARVTFHIEGLKPILMHNPELLMTPEEEGAKVTTKRTPQEQAALGRYIDTASDRLYIPASNFRASLIEGGTNRNFGARRPATKIIGANVFTIDDEERCFLSNAKTGLPIMGSNYVVDIRRVVLPRGTAVLCGRAKVFDWSCDVSFEYDPDLITAALIDEIFGIAGRNVGVCDYRPRAPKGKGGPFGRYRVEMMP